MPGVTLVVSPLISLIQDQVMLLLSVNVPATYLSSTQDAQVSQDVMNGMMKYMQWWLCWFVLYSVVVIKLDRNVFWGSSVVQTPLRNPGEDRPKSSPDESLAFIVPEKLTEHVRH